MRSRSLSAAFRFPEPAIFQSTRIVLFPTGVGPTVTLPRGSRSVGQNRTPSFFVIITLRSALPSDEKDLSLLYTESRRETFTWCDPAIFHEEDYCRETKGEIVDVACDRGRIVGFVSVWELDDFIHHL